MNIRLIDTATVTISITGIEILALKKLSLVAHMLADKIGGASGLEQACLAKTLDDLVRQIEIKAAGGRAS
jgi:hypothetical protein